MDLKFKKIIRIIGVLISVVLLLLIGKVLYDYNVATSDEKATPVRINPSKPADIESNKQEDVIQVPFTRDENDMPKSDVNVPEIG